MTRPRLDTTLLFTTRILRLFAYGSLSVVLALYLSEIGLSEARIGLLLSLTLVGDAGVTLWITTVADRVGRRGMLILGAGLMVMAGVAFLLTKDPALLTLAAIIGVISPSGNEIGPFLSIEQAGLSQLVPDQRRTGLFAWYNLAGSFATATGALAGGWLVTGLRHAGMDAIAAYQVVIGAYAGIGLLLAVGFLLLSPGVEVPAGLPRERRTLGLHKSRGIVFRLTSLFALDAFAGGFVIQAMIAWWFHARFGVDTGTIGSVFFGANVLAGVSALVAVPLARRIGLIRTMVFTHIPSNVLLILVPLMPGLASAAVMLLARFSISQMDVPTRQSYTMAVVAPDERSAASGVTAIGRSVGAAISPSLTGVLLGIPMLISAPFFVGGGLKIVYDLLLYRAFRSVRPPEEK